MGIVNLTPDSFSGDGLANDIERAVEHAWRQIEAGADILDLGAESSRPGAIPTAVDEELRRLLPVLDALAGCGALRPRPDVDYPNACEMKRLYVGRAFRRFGLGRTLAQALIDHATEAGYSTMLLDTLDDMEAARELYATLGFEEIPPYYFNPIAGAHYLKVDL